MFAFVSPAKSGSGAVYGTEQSSRPVGDDRLGDELRLNCGWRCAQDARPVLVCPRC